MKKFLKETQWIGPFISLLGDSLRIAKDRRRVRRLFRENKKTLRLNAELKNSYNGKKCFILATGPSIKKQNLKKLLGEPCISVSNFFVHPDFKTIAPVFHVFASSHRPITSEQMASWFTDAEKHFPEGQKVLVSITDKPIVENNHLFKKQKVFYYLLGDERADKKRGGVD